MIVTFVKNTQDKLRTLKKNRYIGWLIQKIGLSDRRALILFHDMTAVILSLYMALSVTLEDTESMLGTQFYVKQLLVVTFISLAFSLWFQTYKGVWRFFTIRQALLLTLTTASISIVYWPLLTKASLAPVDIPDTTMIVFWLLLTTALVGARIISRSLRFQSIALEAEAQLLTPAYRVILVGPAANVKLFLQRYKALNTDRYDVLGVILTDNQQETIDSQETCQGFQVLGTLDAFQDAYENLKAEDLYPHQVIFLDDVNIGKTSQYILDLLQDDPITFGVMKPCVPLKITPLDLEDLYHTPVPTIDSLEMKGKCVLIFGAACTLGKDLAVRLAVMDADRVILWDQNAVGLERLQIDLLTTKNPLAHTKSLASRFTFTSRPLPDAEQTIAFLSQNAIDIVINLRALAAASAEMLTDTAPFDIMLQENRHLATAANDAGVQNYVFITHETPHLSYVNRLTPLVSDILRSLTTVNDSQTQKKNQHFYAIHTPLILSKESTQFLDRHQITTTQDDISVCSAQYGAYMIINSIANILQNQNEQQGQDHDHDYAFAIVSYETLIKHYGVLQKTRHYPLLRRTKEKPGYTWPKDPAEQQSILDSLTAQKGDDVKTKLTNRTPRISLTLKGIG